MIGSGVRPGRGNEKLAVRCRPGRLARRLRPRDVGESERRIRLGLRVRCRRRLRGRLRLRFRGRLRLRVRRPVQQIGADTESAALLAVPPRRHEHHQHRRDRIGDDADRGIGGMCLRRLRNTRGEGRRLEAAAVVQLQNGRGGESHDAGIAAQVPAHEGGSGKPIERVRFECLDRARVEQKGCRNLVDGDMRRLSRRAKARPRAALDEGLGRFGKAFHRFRLKLSELPGSAAAGAIRRGAGGVARHGPRAARRRRRCRRLGSCE